MVRQFFVGGDENIDQDIIRLRVSRIKHKEIKESMHGIFPQHLSGGMTGPRNNERYGTRDSVRQRKQERTNSAS